MASLKIILGVALFSAVALGYTISRPRSEHNIDSCVNAPEGMQWTKLYSEVLHEKGKFLQIIEREIKWPFSSEDPVLIKCIRVTDLAGDGTSGYPTIKEGGLNYNHVTIHMKSKINHGLFFRITILGEPAYLKPNVTDNYSE